MFDYQTLLAYEFYGNSAESFGVAFAVFLVSWTIFRLFRTRVIARLAKLARRTKTDFDDMLVKLLADIPQYFYVLISFYLGLQFLALSDQLKFLADTILIILVVYRIVIFLQTFFDYGAEKLSGKTAKERADNSTAVNGIKIIARIIIWSAGLLLALANLGFNVSALIASLGIGGVAVAFALQNILGDLFSSFAIYFDKPFAIGDYIVIGEDSGTVKKIGLKTTRIQTLQGEELVISNYELTSTRIHNFRKMKDRRVVFSLGLTYNTTADQLHQVSDIVEKAIGKVKLARLGRIHFKEFGDFSLNFEVVYYVESKDYGEYLDAQQEINFGIKQEFERTKLEIAFPTQTVYVAKSSLAD